MKKFVLFLSLLSFFVFKAHATIHIVSASALVFSPANISVVVGDTIRWIRTAGSHTTTDDPVNNPEGGNVLPAGAPAWNALLTAASPTFDYKVVVPGNYVYSCIPHQDVGMIGTITATAALPVILSEFKLNTANNKPGLSWRTLTEQNTDYFSIRRSYDGTNYTEIAKVPAAGNSTVERAYTYNDINVSAKDKYAYYMVVVVDKDGNTQFTETRLFKNALATFKLITSVSPNPIRSAGHLLLKFNADKPGKMNMMVLNMEGKTVMETSMNAVEGINQEHVQLGNITPGTYNLLFRLNDIKEAHRIIVR